MHRIGRWSREFPFTAALILTLLCVPLVLGAAWVGSDQWQMKRVEDAIARDSIEVAQVVGDAEAALEITFGQIANVVSWVSEDERTLAALSSSHSVLAENEFLHHLAETFNVVDYLHIMDARGVVIASSNAGARESAVDHDFSYREFFQEAIKGKPSRQFAIGKKSGIPGFYFSAPIFSRGQIVGVAVAKVELPTLRRHVYIPGGIIADKYGVVVLADNFAHLFMAMPGATVSKLSKEQAMERYARSEFPPIPLSPAGLAKHPEIMLLDDKPGHIVTRAIANSGWSVSVVSDFELLRDAKHQRTAFFIFSSLTGCGIFLGLWTSLLYFLRARDYRQKLEAANLELKEQATRDFLTGCLNRRAFAEVMRTEMERARRSGASLSVGMLDIDYFKRINDSRGHDGGDTALRFLAERIRAGMRSGDTLARLGGEEFAWLMPNTALDVAAKVVDRMREDIAAQAVTGLEPPLQLKFSAGVAEWREGIDGHVLLNAADEALYAAKEGGRNRVVTAGPSQAS